MTVARQSSKLATCFLVLVASAWSETGSVAQDTRSSQLQYSYEANGYRFTWDLHTDHASLIKVGSTLTLWQGGLLPAFWIKGGSQKNEYIKGEAVSLQTNSESQTGQVSLSFRGLGTGTLTFQAVSGSILFTDLTAHWREAAPAIVSMFFGTSALDPEQRRQANIPDQSFWPDWQAEGFCIPSAKGGPVQSFFRNWDFGDAVLPLGSFGVALGTPYAAAYPRPVYSAAMGGRDGWMAVGSGTVPDGALLLRIQGTNGSLEYLYREDLWGAVKGSSRKWLQPLRFTWAKDAWNAYAGLFRTFGRHTPSRPSDQKNVWNTWGNFKNGDYNLAEITNKASEFRADVLVIDDGWEAGPGRINIGRFPQFESDLRNARAKGLQIGLWEQVLWVKQSEQTTLRKDDFLLGRDGQPIRTAWNTSPRTKGSVCLDPSSPHARQFIREHIQTIVRKFHPELLKLDFGYSSPSPAVAVPRDPSLRGEQLAFTLLKLVVQAAREVEPDITIQYYSIHPLFREVQDVVALDDMGDAGAQEARGHGEWSIWSALAASDGMAIMASSGYDWNADTDILLDTAVIGSQGSVLPTFLDGGPVPQSKISKRSALARWHRRTVGWEPLWLDTVKGSLQEPPEVRSWGRLENGDRLTALVLSDKSRKNEIVDPHIKVGWTGRWALISQDDLDIVHSRRLACIPFDGGSLRIDLERSPLEVRAVYQNEEVHYQRWNWTAGHLVLEAGNGAEGRPDFVGFLILN